MVGEVIAGTAGALGGGGLVAFMIKRLFTKVDALEKEKATKASVDKRFDQALDRIDRHLAEDKATHDTLKQLLATQGADIAHIKGLLDRGNR